MPRKPPPKPKPKFPNKHLRGADHPNARLNERKVSEILRSDWTYVRLAKKYKVNINTIISIKLRRTWRHVKGNVA